MKSSSRRVGCRRGGDGAALRLLGLGRGRLAGRKDVPIGPGDLAAGDQFPPTIGTLGVHQRPDWRHGLGFRAAGTRTTTPSISNSMSPRPARASVWGAASRRRRAPLLHPVEPRPVVLGCLYSDPAPRGGSRRFSRQAARPRRADLQPAASEVVAMEAPPEADEGRFYSAVLQAIGAPEGGGRAVDLNASSTSSSNASARACWSSMRPTTW